MVQKRGKEYDGRNSTGKDTTQTDSAISFCRKKKKGAGGGRHIKGKHAHEEKLGGGGPNGERTTGKHTKYTPAGKWSR